MSFQFFPRAKRSIAALCSFMLLQAAFVVPVALQADAQQTMPAFVPGELLIKMNPNVQAAAAQDVFNRLRIKPLERLNRSGWIRVKLEGNPVVQQMLPQIKQFPQVMAAEPNYIVQANAIPNDTDFSKLWGLHNTGQSGKAGVDIDAPEAWDNFKSAGNRVVVAVIDSGVDYTHPDLAGRIWGNSKEVPNNNVDDDKNGYVDDIRGWDFVNNDNDPMDDNNHGTHCAGTIAAATNNGQGIAGVVGTADVRIMPLKFLDSKGSGPTSSAIKALDYATANGAHVSNNSWGGGNFSQAMQEALQRNHQAGRLFVAAAGNNSRDTDSQMYYPQGYEVPNVISVASITSSDELSSFSNYGAKTVDIAAPGSGILSTIRGGGYKLFNGTSMAAPHVAGAAALVWAKNHTLTNSQVKNVLLDASRKAGYLNGKTLSGGALNIKNAMAAVGAPGSPAPTPDPEPTPPPTKPADPLTVPKAPTNLAGKPETVKDKRFDIRYANLTWTDNADDELKYEVWAASTATGKFRRIKILAANTKAFKYEIGRRPMTTDIYFKVRATNAHGGSAYSNTIKITKF